MSDAEKRTFTDEEALAFHQYPTPGKIAIARDQADGDPARPVAWPIRRAWPCRCWPSPRIRTPPTTTPPRATWWP